MLKCGGAGNWAGVIIQEAGRRWSRPRLKREVRARGSCPPAPTRARAGCFRSARGCPAVPLTSSGSSCSGCTVRFRKSEPILEWRQELSRVRVISAGGTAGGTCGPHTDSNNTCNHGTPRDHGNQGPSLPSPSRCSRRRRNGRNMAVRAVPVTASRRQDATRAPGLHLSIRIYRRALCSPDPPMRRKRRQS